MTEDDRELDPPSSDEGIRAVSDGTGAIRPFTAEGLPRVTRSQERVAHRLRRFDPGKLLADLAGVSELTGTVGPAEVLWRPSGIKRTGVVVQCVWPRFSTRLGLGLDVPLAHEVVARLLGCPSEPDESRLPISPVEWGILTHFFAESLRKLRRNEGPLGAWDLLIDRVSPDPFDLVGIGRIVTVRWPIELGGHLASLRLWLPESLLGRWLDLVPEPPTTEDVQELATPKIEVESEWRAEGARIPLPRGLQSLRVRRLLPLPGDYRRGTILSPEGIIQLSYRGADDSMQSFFLAEVVPESGGGRITLTSRLQKRKSPADPNKGSSAGEVSDPPGTTQMDAPVTLTVELGRVNLTLAKLADMKPGDVIELRRHSREPVELTSGGKTVARGELVQIDDELGVRVTHVLI